MTSLLHALAARFRASKAGRTGEQTSDYTADYRDLLASAGANDGAAREQAEQELRTAAAHSGGLLMLDIHPRDPLLIQRVRLRRDGGSDWLFHTLGQPTPAAEREQLAARFTQASAPNPGEPPLPAQWEPLWQAWCGRLAAAALAGASIAPFPREDPAVCAELLRVLRGLLAWPGESLVRFASCVLCGDSKRLEILQTRLEQALTQVSQGSITSLEALGLLKTPRFVLIHGPLRLTTRQGVLDLGWLDGPVRLSDTDLTQALEITTSASRCLCVENETTFHELAKLQSGTLLIQSSYPGCGTLALYSRLPAALPCWHFGDSDPAGFDILRDLRSRTGREIRPLHMTYRAREDSPDLSDVERSALARLLADPLLEDVHPVLRSLLEAGSKGCFEQESLGWPTQTTWPFYGPS